MCLLWEDKFQLINPLTCQEFPSKTDKYFKNTIIISFYWSRKFIAEELFQVNSSVETNLDIHNDISEQYLNSGNNSFIKLTSIQLKKLITWTLTITIINHSMITIKIFKCSAQTIKRHNRYIYWQFFIWPPIHQNQILFNEIVKSIQVAWIQFWTPQSQKNILLTSNFKQDPYADSFRRTNHSLHGSR